MNIKPIFPMAALLALSACAGKVLPPAITYDHAQFKPALAQHDPAPPPAGPAVPVGAIIGPSAPLPAIQSVDTALPTMRVETANHLATREPTRDGYINAAQIYPFSDNALYRLYTAPGQVSDIALQPGEVLSAISAGDTVRWAVGDTVSGNGQGRQVHVMVKPFAAGLTTNLVILTDRRTYHLVMQSTDHASMATVSWTYPAESFLDKKVATPATVSAIDTGIALEKINFRYAISGDSPPWRPLRAFDDGHKVYIELPERIDQGEAPPLFVVGAGGGSELVNYRVRGNYYVVDRLFGAAELRLGQDKQQVVRISRNDGKPTPGGLAKLIGGGNDR
ncbi:MAG: P-type conjugative transfer protein TrbG [Pseudomonadota bacterium]